MNWSISNVVYIWRHATTPDLTSCHHNYDICLPNVYCTRVVVGVYYVPFDRFICINIWFVLFITRMLLKIWYIIWIRIDANWSVKISIVHVHICTMYMFSSHIRVLHMYILITVHKIYRSYPHFFFTTYTFMHVEKKPNIYIWMLVTRWGATVWLYSYGFLCMCIFIWCACILYVPQWRAEPQMASRDTKLLINLLLIHGT